MQNISLNPDTGRRHWQRQALFGMLVALLFWLHISGVKPYYKFSLLNSLGVNPTLDADGNFRLAPIKGLLGERSGLRQGDTLVSVNGREISANIRQDMQQFLLSTDNKVVIAVRAKDGTMRTLQIHLDTPTPALFGFSAISLARLRSLLETLLVLAFSIPALIIFLRKSDEKLGLFVSITLLLIGFRFTETILYAPSNLAGVAYLLIIIAARILLLVFLFIFPSGTHVANWTKYFVIIGGVWSVVSLFFPALYTVSGGILEIVILTAGLWSQIYRYRHISSFQQKQQTKWIVFGITVAFAVNYLILAISLVLTLRESELGLLRYQLLSQPVRDLSLMIIPVTVSLSIFRYRLYDIDIIINRALVYGALTAILSGMFVALSGFLQRLTLALTGEKTETTMVITTLIVASAITPLRSHVQALVDVHFKETPDPGRRLRAFMKQVQGRLFVVHPEQITHRLLEEIVTAFGAMGGAVRLEENHLMHVTRAWDGRERFAAPIRGREKIYGRLLLGQRASNASYTVQDRQLIEAVTREIGIALEQDEALAESTAGRYRSGNPDGNDSYVI